MSDFKIAYKRTGGYEGGYANDPDDNGGETYKGISRKNFPNWVGWSKIDAAKQSETFPGILYNDEVLNKQVEDFYHTEFWNALNLDQIKDQNICNELYDTAVNVGVRKAATFLQRSLNLLNRNGKDYKEVLVDGKLGENTWTTVNNHKSKETLSILLNLLQGAFYVKICEENPKQEKYLHGWIDKRIEL